MAARLCVPIKKKGSLQPEKKEVENDSNECEESTGSHVWRRIHATRVAYGSKLNSYDLGARGLYRRKELERIRETNIPTNTPVSCQNRVS